MRAEVEVDAQQAAVPQAPARTQGALGQYLAAQGSGAGQARNQLAVADLQQAAVQLAGGLGLPGLGPWA